MKFQLSLQFHIYKSISFRSVLSVYKCKQSARPEYIYNRPFPTNHNVGNWNLRIIDLQEIRIEFRPSLTKSSFFYRASKRLPRGNANVTFANDAIATVSWMRIFCFLSLCCNTIIFVRLLSIRIVMIKNIFLWQWAFCLKLVS